MPENLKSTIIDLLHAELKNFLSDLEFAFIDDETGEWNIIRPTGEIQEFSTDILSDEIVLAVRNLINQ